MLGVLGVAKLMRFIPRTVMVGFVNALAILIFLAQLPELVDVPWLVYPLVALALLMVCLPRLTSVVPAPLVAIVVLTAVTVVAAIAVPDRRRPGRAARQPAGAVPARTCPFTLETLRSSRRTRWPWRWSACWSR